MNIPFFAAAVLITLALAAHFFIGTRETAALRPHAPNPQTERHWLQAACVFQLASIDLLLLAAASWLLAFTDIIADKQTAACLLAAYLTAWSIAWLAQLAAARAQKNKLSAARTMDTLPHLRRADAVGCAAGISTVPKQAGRGSLKP
ncbi:Uncharacterised protein [Kingella potus]|uniref:Uncharacterized protein n=1 Tax=Kingella potus TaxID=265175 RepID=A0A377R3W5_9NEIS|nr:hypothetical protein [Kingella potus]UOP01268.1 hypothetical protein LVJ84_03125 [Kingella potus]STR01001.1 Uncharacterised protein [Kingella potus]